MGCQPQILGDGAVLSAPELAHHRVAAVHAAAAARRTAGSWGVDAAAARSGSGRMRTGEVQAT